MEGIKFKRVLGSKGGVLGITFPVEIREFLDMKEGDELIILPQNKSKGRFLAIYKEEGE